MAEEAVDPGPKSLSPHRTGRAEHAVTAAFWNPLEHGAFGYDNLGQSHPMQAIMNSRYAKDPEFRAHVHRSLVDPEYAMHSWKMNHNKAYAAQQNALREAKDPRAYTPKPGAPTLQEVFNHLRGKQKWTPPEPEPREPEQPQVPQRTRLPKVPERQDDDFEPFPQPKTPTFRDNEEGGLDMITARSRR